MIERARMSDLPKAEYILHEFFAGGGMVRAALVDRWRCLFANDADPMKCQVYRENWGDGSCLVEGDVASLDQTCVTDRADLAWASFPCQDLSVAGNGVGLSGTRSGAFFAFWKLVSEASKLGRGPRIVALENVVGMVTNRGGADLHTMINSITSAGYRCGAVIIDAANFVPQSRPRLFIVALAEDVRAPDTLTALQPAAWCCPPTLRRAIAGLPESSRESWIHWDLPMPAPRAVQLIDLLDDEDTADWHSPDRTRALTAQMSEVNLAKLYTAMSSGKKVVGTVFRRMRPAAGGGNVVRAEVRFDGVAGCLRTPTGGSSRQTIIVVDGNNVRSRLLSTTEARRLMCLPDSYKLPESSYAAYHVCGDGVVVDVVRFLDRVLFQPILAANPRSATERERLASR